MKLTPVESLPSNYRRGGYGHLQVMIREFANGDSDICKLVFTDREYKSPTTCAESMRLAVRRSGCNVRVAQRGNEVFLVKKS